MKIPNSNFALHNRGQDASGDAVAQYGGTKIAAVSMGALAEPIGGQRGFE
jgi:hypothetical protein